MVRNLDISAKESLMSPARASLYSTGKVTFIISFKEEINSFKSVAFPVPTLYTSPSDWSE